MCLKRRGRLSVPWQQAAGCRLLGRLGTSRMAERLTMPSPTAIGIIRKRHLRHKTRAVSPLHSEFPPRVETGGYEPPAISRRFASITGGLFQQGSGRPNHPSNCGNLHTVDAASRYPLPSGFIDPDQIASNRAPAHTESRSFILPANREMDRPELCIARDQLRWPAPPPIEYGFGCCHFG